MRRIRSPASAVAGLALCAGLPAQLRHACIGRVVDAVDSPIAAADVTIASSPDGGAAELDVVHARTDARGYFRADLVVSQAYRAWAIGPAGADGHCLVSEVEEGAAAGVVLELVALHRAAPRALTCSGADAWNGIGPPLLKWRPDAGSGCEIDVAARADGSFGLPPDPWCSSALELRTWDGELAGRTQVEPAEAAPKATFAPPRVQHLRVTGASGNPIDGAEVAQRCGGSWRKVGVADGAGDCLARLIDDGSRKQWFRVAAGSAAAFLTAELPRDARSAVDLRVPLQWGRSEVAASTIVGVRADEIVSGALRGAIEDASGRRTSSMCLQFPVHVDDGKLRFDRLAVPLADCSYFLRLVPRGEGTVRFVLTAPVSAAKPPSVDLRKLRALRIRAVDAANNPQPGARIAVFATKPSWFRPVPSPEWLLLDHAGRADLLLEGDAWAVYATNGTAHVVYAIESSSPDEVLLRLETMRTMRLKVIDGDGRPVRGARIGSVLQGKDWAPGATPQTMIAPLIAWPTAAAARSDRDGILSIPLQEWVKAKTWVQVHAGDLVSRPFPLDTGGSNVVTVEAGSGAHR